MKLSCALVLGLTNLVIATPFSFSVKGSGASAKAGAVAAPLGTFGLVHPIASTAANYPGSTSKFSTSRFTTGGASSSSGAYHYNNGFAYDSSGSVAPAAEVLPHSAVKDPQASLLHESKADSLSTPVTGSHHSVNANGYFLNTNSASQFQYKPYATEHERETFLGKDSVVSSAPSHENSKPYAFDPYVKESEQLNQAKEKPQVQSFPCQHVSNESPFPQPHVAIATNAPAQEKKTYNKGFGGPPGILNPYDKGSSSHGAFSKPENETYSNENKTNININDEKPFSGITLKDKDLPNLQPNHKIAQAHLTNGENVPYLLKESSAKEPVENDFDSPKPFNNYQTFIGPHHSDKPFNSPITGVQHGEIYVTPGNLDKNKQNNEQLHIEGFGSGAEILKPTVSQSLSGSPEFTTIEKAEQYELSKESFESGPSVATEETSQSTASLSDDKYKFTSGYTLSSAVPSKTNSNIGVTEHKQVTQTSYKQPGSTVFSLGANTFKPTVSQSQYGSPEFTTTEKVGQYETSKETFESGQFVATEENSQSTASLSDDKYKFTSGYTLSSAVPSKTNSNIGVTEHKQVTQTSYKQPGSTVFSLGANTYKPTVSQSQYGSPEFTTTEKVGQYETSKETFESGQSVATEETSQSTASLSDDKYKFTSGYTLSSAVPSKTNSDISVTEHKQVTQTSYKQPGSTVFSQGANTFKPTFSQSQYGSPKFTTTEKVGQYETSKETFESGQFVATKETSQSTASLSDDKYKFTSGYTLSSAVPSKTNSNIGASDYKQVTQTSYKQPGSTVFSLGTNTFKPTVSQSQYGSPEFTTTEKVGQYETSKETFESGQFVATEENSQSTASLSDDKYKFTSGYTLSSAVPSKTNSNIGASDHKQIAQTSYKQPGSTVFSLGANTFKPTVSQSQYGSPEFTTTEKVGQYETSKETFESGQFVATEENSQSTASLSDDKYKFTSGYTLSSAVPSKTNSDISVTEHKQVTQTSYKQPGSTVFSQGANTFKPTFSQSQYGSPEFTTTEKVGQYETSKETFESGQFVATEENSQSTASLSDDKYKFTSGYTLSSAVPSKTNSNIGASDHKQVTQTSYKPPGSTVFSLGANTFKPTVSQSQYGSPEFTTTEKVGQYETSKETFESGQFVATEENSQSTASLSDDKYKFTSGYTLSSAVPSKTNSNIGVTEHKQVTQTSYKQPGSTVFSQGANTFKPTVSQSQYGSPEFTTTAKVGQYETSKELFESGPSVATEETAQSTTSLLDEKYKISSGYTPTSAVPSVTNNYGSSNAPTKPLVSSGSFETIQAISQTLTPESRNPLSHYNSSKQTTTGSLELKPSLESTSITYTPLKDPKHAENFQSKYPLKVQDYAVSTESQKVSSESSSTAAFTTVNILSSFDSNLKPVKTQSHFTPNLSNSAGTATPSTLTNLSQQSSVKPSFESSGINFAHPVSNAEFLFNYNSLPGKPQSKFTTISSDVTTTAKTPTYLNTYGTLTGAVKPISQSYFGATGFPLSSSRFSFVSGSDNSKETSNFGTTHKNFPPLKPTNEIYKPTSISVSSNIPTAEKSHTTTATPPNNVQQSTGTNPKESKYNTVPESSTVYPKSKPEKPVQQLSEGVVFSVTPSPFKPTNQAIDNSVSTTSRPVFSSSSSTVQPIIQNKPWYSNTYSPFIGAKPHSYTYPGFTSSYTNFGYGSNFGVGFSNRTKQNNQFLNQYKPFSSGQYNSFSSGQYKPTTTGHYQQSSIGQYNPTATDQPKLGSINQYISTPVGQYKPTFNWVYTGQPTTLKPFEKFTSSPKQIKDAYVPTTIKPFASFEKSKPSNSVSDTNREQSVYLNVFPSYANFPKPTTISLLQGSKVQTTLKPTTLSETYKSTTESLFHTEYFDTQKVVSTTPKNDLHKLWNVESQTVISPSSTENPLSISTNTNLPPFTGQIKEYSVDFQQTSQLSLEMPSSSASGFSNEDNSDTQFTTQNKLHTADSLPEDRASTLSSLVLPTYQSKPSLDISTSQKQPLSDEYHEQPDFDKKSTSLPSSSITQILATDSVSTTSFKPSNKGSDAETKFESNLSGIPSKVPFTTQIIHKPNTASAVPSLSFGNPQKVGPAVDPSIGIIQSERDESVYDIKKSSNQESWTFNAQHASSLLSKPNIKISSEANGITVRPTYTGGFGGPSGILNPNGYKPFNQLQNYPNSFNKSTSVANNGGKVAVESHHYSGGFGGPPGIWLPNDNNKHGSGSHVVHNKQPLIEQSAGFHGNLAQIGTHSGYVHNPLPNALSSTNTIAAVNANSEKLNKNNEDNYNQHHINKDVSNVNGVSQNTNSFSGQFGVLNGFKSSTSAKELTASKPITLAFERPFVSGSATGHASSGLNTSTGKKIF
ncbi:streptococcal hemagglutinin-like [Battus philenor]|uniref:streptococcal hemagglutinin-like n=1 Tax=Battus philenor TaxID=42288 RepID=UPI0035D12390